jgi:hypothetical protein
MPVSCVLLGEEGLGKGRFEYLLQRLVGMCMYLQSAMLKDAVIGRFASPYENRICLCLDEISPEECRAYQRALMDLITSTLGNCEKRGSQLVIWS